MTSLGDVASLIAAIAFVLLVGLLAVPLLKLGRVLDELRDTVRELTEHTVPMLDEATTTVSEANVQLAKVDTVTTSAAEVAENISALTGLYASVLGGPAIAVASTLHGVRKATARAFARMRGVDPDDAAPPSPAPDLRRRGRAAR